MSNNKMLIDSTHPEETRVVVLRGGRVEEFDFESAARKLLRGNIYLAKVTRVEPSLQAAFIDYGGNRHGFLAFNEIHPDYYQIPVADRQALLQEEAEQEAAEEAEADAEAEAHAVSDAGERHAVDVTDLLPPEPAGSGDGEPRRTLASDTGHDRPTQSEAAPRSFADAAGDEVPPAPEDNVVETVDTAAAAEPEQVENVGNEDALEELPSRPRRRQRSYKIQEVIKRRQIILIQVVKEERGTKGAALTTYLSLAGRYTVLMPNTARGGGISRKITNAQDRKRLKAIADELEVPEGMGLIIRTAGAARTKQEIKRDFEYLLRLWENVRDMTLQSTAPSLVYEEGNLIKRSIRDLYTKDVDEIIVAGAEAHGEARDFMRMLMPSHAKNVISYEESEPLFTRFQIERQLNAMFSPYVYLRSGGYLVINQTEALVAVDVNSGKSTREFSIEETALNTNLEASDEIARQLKLRDLAGLIVIDFIDMEEKRNNRKVEHRLKDALRFDRARIQVGRISHFGLMEMSRQRLRTGVLEGSTTQCPHCQGTGIIRSVESVALAVIRGLEDALMTGQPASLVATTTAPVALYILNNKRQFILDMESRHGITVTVQASDKLQGANFTVERGAAPVQATRKPERSAAVSMDWGFEGGSDNEPVPEGEIEEVGDVEPEADARASEGETDADGQRSRRKRRRRGRRDERSDQGAERGERGGERGGRGDHGRDRPRQASRRSSGGEQPAPDDTGALPLDIAGPHDAIGDAVADDDAGEATAGGEPRPKGRDIVGGEDGDGRRGRRGRRRGRRGGRRGREQDLPGINGVSAGHDQPFAGDTENDPGNDPGDGNVSGEQAGAGRGAPRPFDDTGGRASQAPAPAQREEQDPPRPVRQAEPVERRPVPSAAAIAAAAAPVSLGRAAPAADPAPRETSAGSVPQVERTVAAPDAPPVGEPIGAAEAGDPDRPARKGWWQRRFSGE